MKSYDAVVVGSGPNGLAAAVTMAKAGRSVLVIEAKSIIGGGTRTEEATQPGFLHDVCSAVHPLAVASPFFRSLDLEEFGLEWIYAPFEVAHPLEGGDAGVLVHSLEASADNLQEDGKSYLRLMKPFVDSWEDLYSDILQPLIHWPQRPLLLARFGFPALMSAKSFAQRFFKTAKARALFAGIAAHSNAPLTQAGTASIGLMLNVAVHAKGWPIPKGGSKKISEALVSYLKSLGGEVQTSSEVHSLLDIPRCQWVFWDLTPKQILSICKEDLPQALRAKFSNFQYGPGVFKMDWALSEPIPWLSENVRQAGTVHLGGTFEEITASEAAPSQGRISHNPYVLLSQPSLFDSSRAPAGKHTAWAYCHVPHGSKVDMTEAIENQIERFAPGFRQKILARRTLNTFEIEHKNANLIGGDISGGAITLAQLLFRPHFAWNPYRLPLPGHYICSSSTPPGPGVHGMSGFNAALSALRSRG